MIAYFPEPYPDELFYSIMARYIQHTCGKERKISLSPVVRNTRDLFSKLLCNKLTEEAENILGGHTGYRSFLLEHTLIKYYIRFFPSARQEELLYQLCENPKEVTKTFTARSQKGKTRVLRYCPACAKEEREQYGEAYWHCTHQIPELDACKKHKLKLLDSDIPLTSDCWMPQTAEESITSMTSIQVTGEQMKFAEYVIDCYAQPLEISDSHDYAAFFRTKLKETGYFIPVGQYLRISGLAVDINQFILSSDLSFIEPITKVRISKALQFQSNYASVILLISYFLGIAPEELAKPFVQHENIEEYEKALALFVSIGKSYMETAAFAGIDTKTLVKICKKYGVGSKYEHHEANREEVKKKRLTENRRFLLEEMKKYPEKSFSQLTRLSSEHRSHLRWLKDHDEEWLFLHGPKKVNPGVKVDYQNDDEKYQQLAEMIITEMLSSNFKPERITKCCICRKLKLDYRRMVNKMPKTLRVIEDYEETYAVFFARRVEYYVRNIPIDKLPRSQRAFKMQTGIAGELLVKYYHEIQEHCSDGTKEYIRELTERYI